VLSLHSLGVNIVSKVNPAIADLGKLSVDIESKGSEFADVDRVAAAEGVVQVGNETSPNDQHLTAETNKLHWGKLTWDLASRGFWLALVLSVGVLCLPGYLSPFLRILKPARI